MSHSKRILSIDFLKALGAIYMIVLHQLIWVFMRGDGTGLRFESAGAVVVPFCLSGLHVLSLQLPLLAAAVFYCAVQSGRMTGRQVVIRALMLAGFEFLKNFLTWGPADAFDWDVLSFVGLSMLVSYPFIRKMRHPAGLFIVGAAGVAALLLADRFPGPAGWMHSYPYRVLVGDARGENYWPMCPWFSLFAAGLVVGRVLQSGGERAQRKLMAAGAALLIASVASGRFLPSLRMDDLWGAALFKPSPFFIAGVLGFSLLAVPLAQTVFQRYGMLRTLLLRSRLLYFGQGIFWIYLVSICVGYLLTGALIGERVLDMRSATALWAGLVTLILALAYAIGLCTARVRPVVYSA